ncbi:MAG: alanyl-tRNA editing protein [Eubacteriales bacterium]
MTKRLYDLDSHQTETQSTVLSCTAVEDKFDVVLDQTVFFPKAADNPPTLERWAAQPFCTCARKTARSTTVDHALKIGESVSGTIDWTRRFDLMQQHTGEHLLSFSFYDLFQASNVGFHLALDYATIDFDKPVSREEIKEAELLANRFVWKNLPVQATFYEDEAEVAALPLRKHAEGLQPPIRIVHVEGADMCTCCAPHCYTTGEIRLRVRSGCQQLQGRYAHHVFLRRAGVEAPSRAARRPRRHRAAFLLPEGGCDRRGQKTFGRFRRAQEE